MQGGAKKIGKSGHDGRRFLCLLASLLLCVVSAGNAHAQGSRKDDIVLNARGTPLAGATIRVCTANATGQPCAPLALIYSDAALTQAKANPTTTDGLGNYNFYAAPGRYMIEISGPGITTRQIPDVILPSDPTNSQFNQITVTNGITAFSLTLTGNLTVAGSASVTGALLVTNGAGAATPSSGQVALYTKSADKKLYYKDDAGTETGPLGLSGVNFAADGIQYVSPSGNDASSGLSWNKAKLTLYAAYQALPSFGGTIYVAQGSTVAGVAIGGPVAGQGLWILGATDPNFASPPTGWLTEKQVHIIGVGEGTAPQNAPSGPKVNLTGASDNTNGSGGAIVSATESGTTVTITTTSAHVYAVGNIVSVWGVGVQGYNGTWKVVSVPTSTTFTYTAYDSGLASSSGGTVNINNPALWLAGTNNPMLFENLQFSGPNPVRIGVNSNGSRTSTSSASITFRGCAFQVKFGNTNAWLGPAVDIGANALWTWFERPQFSSASAAPPTADNRSAILVYPGSFSNTVSQLVYVKESVMNGGGGLRFHTAGTGTGSFRVENVVEEGAANSQPVVEVLENGVVYGSVENVIISDSGDSPPAVRVDSRMQPTSVRVSRSVSLPISVEGPATIVSDYAFGPYNGLVPITTAPLVSPAAKGQLAIEFMGRSFLQTDTFRRTFGPSIVRFPNLASQLTSAWTVDRGTGVAVASVVAPDGTTNGGHLTCTANDATGWCGIRVFDANRTYAVGDYIMGGVWARVGAGGTTVWAANGAANGTMGVTFPFGGSPLSLAQKAFFASNGGIPSQQLDANAYSQDDGGWQWIYWWAKVTNAGTNIGTRVVLNFRQQNPMDFHAPIFLHVPATSVASDSEAADIALHLASYADNLSTGVLGGVRRLPFAFGGSGDNFFGILDHTALTANRTYTFQDAGGTVAFDNVAQTWSGNQTNVALVTPSIGGDTISASPRALYSALLPGALTSAWTAATLTLDKAITVTRVQVQPKTAPAGCTTSAVVRLSDGSTTQDVTIAAAANDSGAISKNYAAAAALTIAVQTAAAGCTTSPADANVVVQYRLQ
jgi:hypothetical protein